MEVLQGLITHYFRRTRGKIPLTVNLGSYSTIVLRVLVCVTLQRFLNDVLNWNCKPSPSKFRNLVEVSFLEPINYHIKSSKGFSTLSTPETGTLHLLYLGEWRVNYCLVGGSLQRPCGPVGQVFSPSISGSNYCHEALHLLQVQSDSPNKNHSHIPVKHY